MLNNKNDILDNFLEQEINMAPEFAKKLTRNEKYIFPYRNEFYQII